MSYVDVADNASSALMESNLSSPPPVRQGGSSLHPEQVRQRRSSSGFHTPRSPGSRRASSVRGAEYPQLTAKGSAAMQPGATQETIKDYVFSLLEAHADTVEGWNKRVRVVELYRNKQLRQGGEAAAVRPADIAFLERVEHSSEHYMNVIGRAKDLLEAQRDASEDRKDTVSRAWHQYCVRYYGELHDLWLDVSMIHRRTQRLLAVPLQHDPYTPSKFRTDSAPRGRSTSVASQRSRATSVSSRQPSQVLDGTLTCTSPIAKLRRSSSRGGSRPSVSQSSVRRGSEILRPGINGRLSQVHPYRLSIAAEDAPSTTLTGRPLHPSTVLPNTLIGSPYDEKTPYGRLSPYRFDPQRTAAEELYVVDEDSVLADGEVREAGRAEEPSGIVSDHEGGGRGV
ncbi:hypothetical protein ADEAN_000570200 [Angomonas deanei]|uniref:Uncharacterized protein n=1 Tax=Angomonas deanei TaxID=59799 RepID=A0A7G2CFT7_9TRYP|nr:hypothetical protein ADEAN_000570200 [Angomonas deanei]